MLIKIRFFLSIFIFLLCTSAYSVESSWSSGVESKVRLISPYTNSDNKSSIYLGLQYKLQDGWKTYWKSPGAGGFPQNITWSSSVNIKNIEILWPTPIEFKILGLNSVGYQKEVIFPIKLSIIDITKEIRVNLDINYLVCKDICIPGNAKLSLNIPPGKANTTKHFFDIEKSLSQIPNKIFNISDIEEVITKAYLNNNNVSIIINVRSRNKFVDPKFFLDSEFGLPVQNPILKYSSNSKEIEAKFSFKRKLINKDKFDLSFLLIDDNSTFEFLNILEVEKNVISDIQFTSYIYFLIIAFIGGFILNFMPCVLPVLSIKLLSVLQLSNNKKLIHRSFIMTAIGIISSFIVLALLAILLKIMGVNIGWGMQFQQPVFLMVIGTILFIFMLNLFDFFEFKTPNFVNNSFLFKNNLNLKFKDFFNGFFATILATPCSAPFVGTAVTAAFTQSYFVLFGIFVFMGLGMSSPYISIAFFPSLITFLPKPGYWMQILKYILGLLLLGTLIWVGLLLLNHFNYFFILITIFIMIAFSLSIIFLKQRKFVGTILLISFFILPMYFNFDYDDKLIESKWDNFNLSKIEDFIKDDKIVFVDITADWCITCQFNKLNVINSKEIQDMFDRNDVKLIKGDWTKPNEDIEAFLNSYNKFGIPFNIIYSKSYPEGVILSELLTNKEIIKNIELVKKN
jgi:suppressor for copper-sensitivity B